MQYTHAHTHTRTHTLTGVGKSSLLLRFADNLFSGTYEANISADVEIIYIMQCLWLFKHGKRHVQCRMVTEACNSVV